MYSFYPQPGNS
uniref:Uncharacterized protein n=1 Tax=Arundo donax TaxID=35708 RepID=A0A0A9A4D6_ARUDO